MKLTQGSMRLSTRLTMFRGLKGGTAIRPALSRFGPMAAKHARKQALCRTAFLRSACRGGSSHLPDSSRNDECLGVMHNEWFEISFRAFDDCLTAFDKVQHMDRALSLMGYWDPEPVASSLDEFEFVQAGPFFAPAFATYHQLKLIDE